MARFNEGGVIYILNHKQEEGLTDIKKKIYIVSGNSATVMFLEIKLTKVISFLLHSLADTAEDKAHNYAIKMHWAQTRNLKCARSRQSSVL